MVPAHPIQKKKLASNIFGFDVPSQKLTLNLSLRLLSQGAQSRLLVYILSYAHGVNVSVDLVGICNAFVDYALVLCPSRLLFFGATNACAPVCNECRFQWTI